MTRNSSPRQRTRRGREQAATHYFRRQRKRGRKQQQGPLPLTMEAIFSHENLYECYQTLHREGGPAPGIDGITYTDLSPSEVSELVDGLSRCVLQGTYRPYPTRPQDIQKQDGKSLRTLRMGIIADRVVAKALQQVLDPLYDEVFLDGSYGYRPGLSTWQMLADMEARMVQEDCWVLALDDIKGAFDNLSVAEVLQAHRRMLSSNDAAFDSVDSLSQNDTRRRLLKLLAKVTQGADPNRKTGVDQGCPISPLTLNAVLHFAHDAPMQSGVHRRFWFRYSDNLVYLRQSRRKGHQALKRAQDLLGAHGLELGGGGVYDLDAGDRAPLLGFELHKHDGRLKSDLSTKAWLKLEKHLREAHEDPTPLEAAKAKIGGWANAYGPALHKRGPQATRILRKAAEHGFREIASYGDLKGQLKASWERWLELRGTN
jgi:RNA-directed DNA polymerase